MDDFKRMAVFASVVQHGTLSGAARAWGMSPSAVSQQLRQLEREGGVTLLHRSTRKLALTDAGERFYERCAAMVQAAEMARAEMAASRETPSGVLRLSATVGFARHLSPALGGLLGQFPALRLHLLVDDAPIDLIQARVDLAIRFGPLADSSWVAKRLGALQWWPCAAPAWLEQHGTPDQPEQLLQHQWLGFAREGGGLALDLQGPHGATRSLRAEPRLVSNNQLSIQQMCVSGLGLALLGSIDASEHIAAGRLVRLLPEWTLRSLDIWAVTAQRDAQPAKVRLAIAELQRYLLAQPGVLP
jgi:DNA-binding transcriptional LysR family regulator